MALISFHKDVKFGVGDTVRVHQNILEGNKKRLQVFEGMVIAIRGRQENRNFIVRRIGSNQVGIEKIFPLNAPVIEKIEVVRSGVEGVRRAKLYFTRGLPKKEIEKIYQRKTKMERASVAKKAKKTTRKKIAGKPKKASKKSAKK